MSADLCVKTSMNVFFVEVDHFNVDGNIVDLVCTENITYVLLQRIVSGWIDRTVVWLFTNYMNVSNLFFWNIGPTVQVMDACNAFYLHKFFLKFCGVDGRGKQQNSNCVFEQWDGAFN